MRGCADDEMQGRCEGYLGRTSKKVMEWSPRSRIRRGVNEKLVRDLFLSVSVRLTGQISGDGVGLEIICGWSLGIGSSNDPGE